MHELLGRGQKARIVRSGQVVLDRARSSHRPGLLEAPPCILVDGPAGIVGFQPHRRSLIGSKHHLKPVISSLPVGVSIASSRLPHSLFW